MLTPDAFLQQIEQFLKRTKMSATAFGREALRDPNFVSDLREGRAPSLSTAQRVMAFMAKRPAPLEQVAS